MYFRFMAAIFDFPFTPTSESIHYSFTVLLHPENMEDSVGISLPATIQDLHSELYMCFRYHISHFDFRFNTVGFLHSVTLWAAVVTSMYSKNSEATLCSFPYVKYVS